jgi:hypothetical protein
LLVLQQRHHIFREHALIFLVTIFSQIFLSRTAAMKIFVLFQLFEMAYKKMAADNQSRESQDAKKEDQN